MLFPTLTYEFEILIAADNARPRCARVKFDYDPQSDELTQVRTCEQDALPVVVVLAAAAFQMAELTSVPATSPPLVASMFD